MNYTVTLTKKEMDILMETLYWSGNEVIHPAKDDTRRIHAKLLNQIKEQKRKGKAC